MMIDEGRLLTRTEIRTNRTQWFVQDFDEGEFK
jgi:hypothetical protein